MKIYLVGGAVRDKLLGLPVKERDWVVVGATVAEMLQRGFKQVGKEFPVFIHPHSGEEYALARMERKTGPGYKGFAFDTAPTVSLEDDLSRRDLTINAMAEDESGRLIDPFDGLNDLQAKRLRHVSDAFIEDPVRILRVGRFLARYYHLGFRVDAQTWQLMQHMVQQGEVNALVPERVWKELERALLEQHPEQFFITLDHCGCLAFLFPAIQLNSNGMKALINAVALTHDPAIRFAVLCYEHAEHPAQPDMAREAVMTLAKRYRLPNRYQSLAVATALYAKQTIAMPIQAENFMYLFKKLDAFRQESRFHSYLQACAIIAQTQQQPFNPALFTDSLAIAKSVETQPLLDQGLSGLKLAERLASLRLEKIAEWLRKTHGLPMIQ